MARKLARHARSTLVLSASPGVLRARRANHWQARLAQRQTGWRPHQRKRQPMAKAHAETERAPTWPRSAGPVPDRLGAPAGGGLVSWQTIVDFEPGEPLANIGMAGGWPLPGILKRAVQQMDLARPVHAGVGQRRAATAAKVALDARRGGIARGFALEVAKLLQAYTNVGRHRCGHGTPAARTVAMHHPLRRALEGVRDRAALAAAVG